MPSSVRLDKSFLYMYVMFYVLVNCEALWATMLVLNVLFK